jgi:hypothetical protein
MASAMRWPPTVCVTPGFWTTVLSDNAAAVSRKASGDPYEIVGLGKADTAVGCSISVNGNVVAEQPVGGSGQCVYTAPQRTFEGSCGYLSTRRVTEMQPVGRVLNQTLPTGTGKRIDPVPKAGTGSNT